MDKEISISFTTPPTLGVRIPMRHHYRAFMEAIAADQGEVSERFLAGVQCVVWGSLYVEATANQTADRLFAGTFGAEEPQEKMWELAERAALRKKVQALAQVSDSSDDETDQHMKQLKRLTRLRNDLVHYKESPTSVDPSIMQNPVSDLDGFEEDYEIQDLTFGDFIDSLNDELPNPDIVHSVLSMPLEDRKAEVIDLGEWLEGLEAT